MVVRHWCFSLSLPKYLTNIYKKANISSLRKKLNMDLIMFFMLYFCVIKFLASPCPGAQ